MTSSKTKQTKQTNDKLFLLSSFIFKILNQELFPIKVALLASTLAVTLFSVGIITGAFVYKNTKNPEIFILDEIVCKEGCYANPGCSTPGCTTPGCSNNCGKPCRKLTASEITTNCGWGTAKPEWVAYQCCDLKVTSPTPTAVPTPTPVAPASTPIFTPTPTAVPTPTPAAPASTPTNTIIPTPTPSATSFMCRNLTYSPVYPPSDSVERGTNIIFSCQANGVNNSKANFRILKQISIGMTIFASTSITTKNTQNIYDWSYTIPQTMSLGTYVVECQICDSTNQCSE